MSAVELELISGVFLPMMSGYLRVAVMMPPTRIESIAPPQQR